MRRTSPHSSTSPITISSPLNLSHHRTRLDYCTSVYMKTMTSRRALYVIALLAATVASAGSQVLREPGNVASSPSGASGSNTDAARRAQQDFEKFRHMHLPSTSVGNPGNCDENVGRFCYWYNEKDVMPKEPRAIADARDAFLNTLKSLDEASPGDRWITGQRVRYL